MADGTKYFGFPHYPDRNCSVCPNLVHKVIDFGRLDLYHNSIANSKRACKQNTDALKTIYDQLLAFQNKEDTEIIREQFKEELTLGMRDSRHPKTLESTLENSDKLVYK